MSKENGFLQLRRGVFPHVRDGRMTMTEAFCYVYMLSQADTRTGLWNGSAGALAGELAMSKRTARAVLEALDGKYIKRFPVPGHHHCYPIALHKFLITDGQHNGQQLNALESNSSTDLRYFLCQHDGNQDVQHNGQHIAAQKRIETKRLDKPLAAASPLGMKLAALLRQYRLQNDPNANISEAHLANWGRVADLMLSRDRRTEAQIREHIEWCQRDPFWRAVILSMSKLREKFDQLTVTKNKTNGGNHGNSAVQNERAAENFRRRVDGVAH